MKCAASDYQSKLISTDPLTPPGSSIYDCMADCYYGEEEMGPGTGGEQILYAVTVQFYGKSSLIHSADI